MKQPSWSYQLFDGGNVLQNDFISQKQKIVGHALPGRHTFFCAYQEAKMVEDTLAFSNDIHLLKQRLSV